MFAYDPQKSILIGPGGTLPILPSDQASLKMAMLLQGECTEIGPTQAAKIFQYSKSRYYQIRETFIQYAYPVDSGVLNVIKIQYDTASASN